MTRARIKLSDTKAPCKKGKKGKSGAKISNYAEKILETMLAVKLKRGNCNISFEKMMEARDMSHKNKTWRNTWRDLIEEGFIQPATSSSNSGKNGLFTSNYELTDKGEDGAGSPDQKELKRLMEATVNTTKEHHARIRKLCMNNRAVQIFDILLKHGSLTRKEVAATVGINDRGGPFSYGLRGLKRLGYIVVNETKDGGKKCLMLSDKAFIDPKDRQEPISIDSEVMSANIEKVYGKEMRQAAARRSSVKKGSTIKVEGVIKTENVIKAKEPIVKIESVSDTVIKLEGKHKDSDSGGGGGDGDDDNDNDENDDDKDGDNDDENDNDGDYAD